MPLQRSLNIRASSEHHPQEKSAYDSVLTYDLPFGCMLSAKNNDQALVDYFGTASDASDAVSDLLQSSGNGVEIRREWLKILAKQFNATHALCDCMSWDPQQELLVFHDSCFALGNKDWIKLEQWANGLRLDASGFDASHLGEWMRASILFKSDQPEPIVDKIWTPFGIHSGITLSVMHQGLYAGGISLFRDKSVPTPFETTTIDIQGRAWEAATCQLIKATFPMLSLNSASSGSFLFKQDGELALANNTAKEISEDLDSLGSLVKEFAKSDEPKSLQRIGMQSIHLSWLRGRKCSLILALCTPLSAVKVSDFGNMTYLQRKVAKLAANGSSNSQIAVLIERSEATVKSHIEAIYSVLGLENRAELARVYHSGLQWRP